MFKIGDSYTHKKYGMGTVVIVTDKCIGLNFTDKGRVNFSPSELIPAVLREFSITWNLEIASFIRELAESERTRLYLETIDKTSNVVETKYHKITDVVLIPKSGEYNIAPESAGKWSTEATVYFDPRLEVPIGLPPAERKGQINSIELFWSLVRLGFRLGCTQDKLKILGQFPK